VTVSPRLVGDRRGLARDVFAGVEQFEGATASTVRLVMW
jgi:hypothetical protein